MKENGKITVAFGTAQQHQLEIEEYVKAKFKDDRLFSVLKIEGGSFVVSVQNPPESGRTTQQMWLSKDSLVGIAGAIMLYFTVKGEDIHELIRNSADGEEVPYTFSDNITDQMNQPDELESEEFCSCNKPWGVNGMCAACEKPIENIV